MGNVGDDGKEERVIDSSRREERSFWQKAVPLQTFSRMMLSFFSYFFLICSPFSTAEAIYCRVVP